MCYSGTPRSRVGGLTTSWCAAWSTRPTLEATSCALVFDEPVDGVWASDHFGVVADLVVPSPSTPDRS